MTGSQAWSSKRSYIRLLCIGALTFVFAGCGGGSPGSGSMQGSGGSSAPGGGGGGSGSGSSPTTSLSCNGFPQSVQTGVSGMLQTYIQVCLIVQEYAAVTPGINASTELGNLIAHGGQISDTYVVYSRIIAQAADEGTATALAKSVVITAANGTITATPDQVASPQALMIDFEIFTTPSTSLTLSTTTGNVTVDNYNATVRLTSQTGAASLDNVQGDVSVGIATGSLHAKLLGSGWSGTGMTVSIQTGGIDVSRPSGYQAMFTAESALGTVAIDDKTASSTTPGSPAAVTAGTGAPIVLKTQLGAVAVSVGQ